MKAWIAAICLVLAGVGTGAITASAPVPPAAPAEESGQAGGRTVCILPIREDIQPPLTYIVRRGVKEAMEAKAHLLVIDLDTNGGRVDVTEEIIGILGRFPGETVTYVNRKAFSAGAFIAVATQHIYMADEAVIGAATPMMLMPGGGPAELPESVEAKMTSGIKGLIRARAEKNGHNLEVIEAMIDRHKELVLDGKTINPKGQILTLTSREAATEYGNPPKPLLSSGTFSRLDDLLDHLGYADARRLTVKPTGVEQLALWLNLISPLLLALGALGVYLEFKSPGFGVAGTVAIVALLLYFAGGYVAGLSGMEWILVFALGAILVGLEIFVFPGTLALGTGGALLIVIAIVMAAADSYPGMPAVPSLPQLHLPARNLALATALSAAGVWVLGMLLPKTPAFRTLVSQGTSGMASDAIREEAQAGRLGREGIALSVLRPGGKARFGDDILDVVSQGDLIGRGTRVRIVGFRGNDAVVEATGA